jgi:hypothetical protein
MRFVPNFQILFDTEFSAIRCIEKVLLSSHCTIQTQLTLNENTTSAEFENIVKKLSFWVEIGLQHSIIFDVENTWASERFLAGYDANSQNNIVLTPLTPDDAHLGCLILSKFNALSNNLAEVDYIRLNSNSGNGISYVYYGTGNETLPLRENWLGGKFTHLKPWWDRNDTTTWDSVIGSGQSPQNHPLFDDLFEKNRSTIANNATIIQGDFKRKRD